MTRAPDPGVHVHDLGVHDPGVPVAAAVSLCGGPVGLSGCSWSA